MHTFKAVRGEIDGLGFAPDDQCLQSTTSAVVPVGSMLATYGGEGVRLWSVPDCVEVHDEELRGSLINDLWHLPLGGRGARSADGFSCFEFVGELHRWSFESDLDPVTCSWGGTRESNGGKKFPVGALAAHPSDPVLAMSCGVLDEEQQEWRSGIEFFDIGSGEQLALFVAPFRKAHIERLAYSPDGSVIVGLNGPMWRAWSIESGELVAERECGRKHLRDLAFSPDGDRMVTVGNDTNVRVWTTNDWSEATGFEWDIGPLTCVAVSPDGTLYAAGSKKGKVVLWDDWP